MTRLTSLIAAAAMVLPMPAFAAEDCTARIDAIESHSALTDEERAGTAAAESEAADSSGAPEDSAEQEVEEQTENGEAVEENGGTTVYQEGGPAGPRENWFGSPPDKAKVLEHVAAAKEARDAGDRKTCLQEVQRAEKIMAAETEEEQDNEKQSGTQSD